MAISLREVVHLDNLRKPIIREELKELNYPIEDIKQLYCDLVDIREYDKPKYPNLMEILAEMF